MHEEPRIIVRCGRERPFTGRHPWLFSGAVERLEGEPADGDEVSVHGHDGRFIARGLYNSRSQIRVRLYSWCEGERLDRDFWRRRIREALALRRDVLKLPGGADAAWRLLFSEADGLSGLTVDRYGEWLAVQFTSLAMAMRKDLLLELLAEAVRPRGIMLRTEKGVGDAEGLALEDGPVLGEEPAGSLLVKEDDLTFEVDIRTGQKTGFYLDQRENRRLVRSFARGRRALDVCTYTGAFALHMARGGAASVEAVDVSSRAIEAARGNAARNGLEGITFCTSDAFAWLEEAARQGRRFDLLVLDPPRFTHSRRALDQALRGYLRLNALALAVLEKDGILATCSCSGRVSREDFIAVVAEASARAGRALQILLATGQAPDHPVAAACPETAYLKCLLCRVP